VAAIGVRVARWVTSHGFALNLDPDLSAFDLIVPCGIPDRSVTSVARLLGAAPARREVEDLLARWFGEVFGRTMEGTALPPRRSS
jgi:lipoyl(octanoyl) transferase